MTGRGAIRSELSFYTEIDQFQWTSKKLCNFFKVRRGTNNDHKSFSFFSLGYGEKLGS